MNHHLPCPKIRRGQEDLTPEQAAYAHQFAQERIAAMLSTAAIDEEEAEEHLRVAYRVAGLEPVPVRWFDSPVAFIQAHIENSVGEDAQTCVRKSVWSSVGDHVRASVRDRVGTRVWASVGDRMGDNVTFLEWDDIMYGEVLRVRDCVEDSVRSYSDANWHAVYRFFHEVFKENHLIHLARFNEMVSGSCLGSKQAWLVRKPICLVRDEQGRLHSCDGMCIQYRDGWGFSAWHGTTCSEKLIRHPEQLTKEEWMNEQNLEVRRLMQERLGNERFVELVGGRCMNRGRRADLIEVDLRDDPERVARFVQVKDTSTERVYYLRVPPTLNKADKALAWTFGLEEKDYQPLQEA